MIGASATPNQTLSDTLEIYKKVVYNFRKLLQLVNFDGPERLHPARTRFRTRVVAWHISACHIRSCVRVRQTGARARSVKLKCRWGNCRHHRCILLRIPEEAQIQYDVRALTVTSI